MPDNGVTIVQLDVPADPVERAQRIIDWLVSSGVAVDGDTDADGRHALVPGPRYVSAFQTDDAGDGVGRIEVTGERDYHYPSPNVVPAACHFCDSVLSMDAYAAYLETWFDSGEPFVECATCGTQSRLGDWVADRGVVIGAPTVTFHSPPADFDERFLADLRGTLGARSVIVRWHH